jgi:hypothetical protein
MAAEEAAIPAAEAVEFLAIARVENAELALDRPGVEQPRLELVERLLEGFNEPAPVLTTRRASKARSVPVSSGRA